MPQSVSYTQDAQAANQITLSSSFPGFNSSGGMNLESFANEKRNKAAYAVREAREKLSHLSQER